MVPIRQSPQKSRVPLHIVYAEDLDAPRAEIVADSERFIIALGARLVRNGFEKGLPAMTDEQRYAKIVKALHVFQDVPILEARFSETDSGIEDEAVSRNSSAIELRQSLLGPSEQEFHRVTICRNGLAFHDGDG